MVGDFSDVIIDFLHAESVFSVGEIRNIFGLLNRKLNMPSLPIGHSIGKAKVALIVDVFKKATGESCSNLVQTPNKKTPIENVLEFTATQMEELKSLGVNKLGDLEKLKADLKKKALSPSEKCLVNIGIGTIKDIAYVMFKYLT